MIKHVVVGGVRFLTVEMRVLLSFAWIQRDPGFQNMISCQCELLHYVCIKTHVCKIQTVRPETRSDLTSK